MCVCAGGGFGMLVCLVWWMWVCADLSGYVCVCVFFFWDGVGGCGFVPVVAVGVVATVVVGGRCCSGGGCAIVVVVVDDDDDRE